MNTQHDCCGFKTYIDENNYNYKYKFHDVVIYIGEFRYFQESYHVHSGHKINFSEKGSNVFLFCVIFSPLYLEILSFTVVIELFSRVWLFATPWTRAHQDSLSFTISRSLLKLMSIESVMQSNHLVLCHPLLLLPSILPSIKAFSNVLTHLIRWPKYWSFSFSIRPSNVYSGLISFRIDWFALAVQGTLKSP